MVFTGQEMGYHAETSRLSLVHGHHTAWLCLALLRWWGAVTPASGWTLGKIPSKMSSETLEYAVQGHHEITLPGNVQVKGRCSTEGYSIVNMVQVG